MDPDTQRQQLLFVYLEHSGLEGRIVGWSFHDGSGTQAELPGEPPYRTTIDAMQDGWRVIQASPVPVRSAGAERVTGRLEHEVVLERIVTVG